VTVKAGLTGTWILVFNATFNNISVISWQSVLLVGEIWVPGEISDLPQVTDKQLSHNVVSSTPLVDCLLVLLMPNIFYLLSFHSLISSIHVDMFAILDNLRLNISGCVTVQIIIM
jgi:hypothetical protein